MNDALGTMKVGLLCLVMGAGACQKPTEPTDTGMVRLQLVETVGTDSYRLHGATFTVRDLTTDALEATLSSETDPSAAFVTTTLPIGSYTVTLVDGWDLQRSFIGKYTTVDARLTSVNPVQFVISGGQTTKVGYQFHTSGGAITFGTLDIGIDVVVDVDGGADAVSCAAVGADCRMAGAMCCVGSTCDVSSGVCAAVTPPPIATCTATNGDCSHSDCCDGNLCLFNHCYLTSYIYPDCPTTGQSCTLGGTTCCSGTCSGGVCGPR